MRKNGFDVRKITTTWNSSFSSRRRQDDDEILDSHLRSDLYYTSGRRPPVRRRGCLSALMFGGEHFRIRSHESNTKRAGLWLGTKIFLCPITGKDFKWFRNWSVKRRIPGFPLSLDFSSPYFFARPFSLFPATTSKCPWVSEDGQ